MEALAGLSPFGVKSLGQHVALVHQPTFRGRVACYRDDEYRRRKVTPAEARPAARDVGDYPPGDSGPAYFKYVPKNAKMRCQASSAASLSYFSRASVVSGAIEAGLGLMKLCPASG